MTFIRYFLFVFVFLLSALSIAEVQRPNVLLLLADDLGINDISFNNQGELVLTPNIDALASGGHYFSRFYTDSTCSPSRAALLSGMHPARVGFSPVGRGLSPQLETLPEVLASYGYETHHIGKWHLGEGHPLSMPEKQGFKTSFGFVDQWKLQGPDKNGEWKNKTPTYYNPWLRDEAGNAQQYQGHLEEILAGKTVELIRSKNKKNPPWFIYHAFFAPHEPMQPEQSYKEIFGESGKGKYQALVKQLDNNVGRIIGALRETGQIENTIVIFVSDNGGTERFFQSNYPFDGYKGNYHGGGMIAPMAIYWPKRFSSKKIKKAVAIYDIYPTLLNILSIKSRPVDGLDIYQQQHSFLLWEKHNSFSVMDLINNYRYLAASLGGDYTVNLFSNGLNLLPIFFKDISQNNTTMINYLERVYFQWKLALNRADTQKVLGGEYVEILGDDFRRSFGSRKHAMMFAFHQQQNQAVNIVGQKGLFDFSVDKNGNYIFNFKGQKLQLSSPKSGCKSVLVNSQIVDISNVLSRQKPVSYIEIQVGEKKQKKTFFYQSSDDSISEATQIHTSVENFAIYSEVVDFNHSIIGAALQNEFDGLCGKHSSRPPNRTAESKERL